MVSRRDILKAGAGVGLAPFIGTALAQDFQSDILQPLDYPSLPSSNKQLFGSFPASNAQREKADQMIDNAPIGPRPINIAQYFIQKYSDDPKSISAWPADEAWNPLIVRFFDVAPQPRNTDTVPWCAAFMNWCLQRAHRPETKSASSQSFLSTKLFADTQEPVFGDIVVFTCHDLSGNSLHCGHVTFFNRRIDDKKMVVTGGNQSGALASIISDATWPTTPFRSSRNIGGKRVAAVYRISRYLRVV